MGKKAKVGKQRKDKFYKLAKETGYRSRAAFKLLQLNRRYEFLQKSRVLVDLCAAPGGWLQVAQQAMPVSSVIIGVDLVSIKPIPNVISLQEDITTETCRQALRKQLKTWKADVVLHDGAPNVGKNWIHDAFAQAQLTLNALKLATQFLVSNGWFVTKVFRSKDYNSLIWVLGKLFKKVHVTKPQASRSESAEIFIVCQGYKAPDKIDPKFLDSAYLFKDLETKTAPKLLGLQHSTKKPKAEGYDEGDKSVFHRLNASEFIFGDNHIQLLSNCTEIVFDDEDIRDHKTTTTHIKEYCEDIKVLGKKELRALLAWRKSLRESIKKHDVKEQENAVIQEEEDDMKEVDAAVKESELLEQERYKELKRKKKKILREKKKIHEKLNLKMIIKDDEPVIEEERELFSIKTLKSKKDLINLEDDEVDIDEEKDEDSETEVNHYKKTYVMYDKHRDYNAWDREEGNEDASEKNSDSDDAQSEEEELEFSTYENSDDDEDETILVDQKDGEDGNPLLVDLIDKSEKVKNTVDKWFDKDFLNINEEDELDLELLAENSKKQRSTLPVESTKKDHKRVNEHAKTQSAQHEEESCSDKDMEDEEVNTPETNSTETVKKKKKKRVILDPEGLALGALMIHSKKARRDIIDSAYNRYASNDVGLPDWFVKDEAKHNRKELPVSSEMVSEYKARLREINARPIKKVIEAKARKRQKAMRKLEKARKRAEAITEDMDMGNKEKNEQMKAIYKKALQTKKDDVTYVVAKKGVGKRARRPPGVKGRYKMVDKRMKKDDRLRKNELKSNKFKPKEKHSAKKRR